MDINQAFFKCCFDLEDLIIQFPECGIEYAEQTWGVFSMWMTCSGYLPDDENDTIAFKREYVDGIHRFGAAMQKKAGF